MRAARGGRLEQEQQERYFQLTGGWIGDWGRKAVAQSGASKILVLGGGDPLLVDIAQIDIAARTFDIEVDGFSVSGRFPSDEERSSGAGWVLHFGGG